MPTAPPGAEPRPSLLERFRTRWREDGPAGRGRGHAAAGGDGASPIAGAEPPPTNDSAGVVERDQYKPPAVPAAAEEPVRPEVSDPDFPEAPPEPPPVEAPVEQWPEPVEPAAGDPRVEAAPEEADDHAGIRRRERRHGRRRRDPRHVRAVPTNAEAKVERALELFNASEYSRTVGGLVRTLGAPWVAAFPSPGSSSEVSVVVAWELSWYHYRVDLADADPVALTDKGKELGELSEDQRRWNAVSDPDGMLALGVPREP